LRRAAVSRRSPRLLGAFATASATAVALLGAGCGGSARTIDHTVVENAIAVSVAKEKHMLSIVTCPIGVKARQGVKFTCTVTLADGRQIPFTVTGKDDKGNVHYTGF
jgi:hypothetical protein